MMNTYRIRFRDHVRTLEREVFIRPYHAKEECDRKLFRFERDRYFKPAAIVLGYETYINLCMDVARMSHPLNAPIEFHDIPHITDYKKIPLLVDDELCWGATLLPALKNAWPRYGKDEVIHEWPQMTKESESDTNSSCPSHSRDSDSSTNPEKSPSGS